MLDREEEEQVFPTMEDIALIALEESKENTIL